MKTRRLLIITFTLLLWATASLAQESEIEGVEAAGDESWKILRGLPGIGIVVEDIHLTAEKDGLRREAILSTVELELRRAGIRVLSEEELFSTFRRAFLYVEVYAVKNNSGFYAYSVQVGVMEAVSMFSEPFMGTLGRTWNTNSSIGITTVREIRRKAEGRVVDMVRDFAIKFLRANATN